MNELSPMFSIITVCRNNLDGLIRTRESVISQSYSNYEWFVIDGASSDGTKSYLEGLPLDTCNWISEPDMGLYDAMNKGIARANGTYVLFLNSGDELANSNVLESVVSYCVQGTMPHFIYGDAYEEQPDGSYAEKKAYTHRMIWYGMFTHHQAMFFLRSIMPASYSLDLRYAADYGFVAEHLIHSDLVCRIPIIICKFESGGLSQTGSIMIANKEQWQVRREVMGHTTMFCVFVYSLHVFILTIKKRIPFFYRFLRSGNVQ